MKRKFYLLLVLVTCSSLVFHSCTEDTQNSDVLSVQTTNTSLKSHATINFPIGGPTDFDITALQFNGNDYYCTWGGTMIVNPYNPIDYTGLVIKKMVKGSQTWDVTPIKCYSADYVGYSYGVLRVEQEAFYASFSYCAKLSTTGSCAEWKTLTQKKILVKILDPHGAYTCQFALVPEMYLQGGLTIE